MVTSFFHLVLYYFANGHFIQSRKIYFAYGSHFYIAYIVIKCIHWDKIQSTTLNFSVLSWKKKYMEGPQTSDIIILFNSVCMCDMCANVSVYTRGVSVHVWFVRCVRVYVSMCTLRRPWEPEMNLEFLLPCKEFLVLWIFFFFFCLTLHGVSGH